MGFIFVPLTTISFSTLAPQYRNEATALYSLLRNIGSSIGISVVMTYLAQRTQINHAAFANYITPYNQALDNAVAQGAIGELRDDLGDGWLTVGTRTQLPARLDDVGE